MIEPRIVKKRRKKKKKTCFKCHELFCHVVTVSIFKTVFGQSAVITRSYDVSSEFSSVFGKGKLSNLSSRKCISEYKQNKKFKIDSQM